MRTYENKDELKNEINKSFAKYISEFNDIPEHLKDKRIDEIDRTPAENLAAAFGRPAWDISFHVNMDAASLIGMDTFAGGQVVFRPGPVYRCAQCGGFGVLDEINMAKNEALAVLHAVLDFRRAIDVPGYDRIPLAEETRFIATMNYGYAGTRELNEALTSRFVVIQMPTITQDNLEKLLRAQFPDLAAKYVHQFALLFLTR